MNSYKTKPLVVFVLYPEFKLLDLAGPLQAFNDALEGKECPAYETAIVSMDGNRTRSDTCVELCTDPITQFSDRNIDTIIAVGGGGAKNACKDAHLLEGIKILASKSRRVGAVCNGAFLLAACGLLKGRRAVTHWESCEELAEIYPETRVESDPIFINDNNIWTSAGVTAGLDMALAMISEDLGKSAALTLARSLVTYIVRPGGQSQFSEVLKLQTSDDEGRFDKLHHWIRNNLDQDLRVDALANRAMMSSRNFARTYLSETRQTPAKAVEALRVEAARNMLENGQLPLKTIVRRCGFINEDRMRRSFLRLLKITPTDYSKCFRKTDL